MCNYVCVLFIVGEVHLKWTFVKLCELFWGTIEWQGCKELLFPCYYNGSLEKRLAFLVLSTCCFADFKPLKLLRCIICLSVLLRSDWAAPLEVFYLFSEVFETSLTAQGLSDFIKGKAVNACVGCSDLHQQ